MLSESFTFSVEDSSGGMAPLWDLKETIQNEVLAKVRMQWKWLSFAYD